MKVLLKNQNWVISFKNVTLVCEISSCDKIFQIKFLFNGKKICIKSSNIDNTFRYLEKRFNGSVKILKENEKIAS